MHEKGRGTPHGLSAEKAQKQRRPGSGKGVKHAGRNTGAGWQTFREQNALTTKMISSVPPVCPTHLFPEERSFKP